MSNTVQALLKIIYSSFESALKNKSNAAIFINRSLKSLVYDLTQKIGLLQFVEDRTRNTLLPIIEQYVLPGSEIYSDMWAAYNAISAMPVIPPYIHKTVNHSQNFVDPVNGACTNHVECFWKNAKQRNKQMSGTNEEMLPGYLDEFMWRQLNGKKTIESFNNLFLHYYPV